MRQIDPDFLALPLRQLADAALQRARDLGASHADFRLERVRAESLALYDARLEGAMDADDLGYAVRVVKNGTWGFAAASCSPPRPPRRWPRRPVKVAEVSAPINREPIELAPEPVHGEVSWSPPTRSYPFSVPQKEKVALLADWSAGLLKGADHVSARLLQVKEQKFYADTAGTVTTQQRVRVHPELNAMKAGPSGFDDMSTIAPPVGRGYEYLTNGHYDWQGELAQLPELLAEKLAAPSVEAGDYDLVIHPSNLWLTIHESIGHATELDRALGYEAAYAGTSFATFDQLGTLVYGSPVMNVVGDRTVEHGLSTIGYDDEGVATREFDIVKDGILVGYQLDRRMALMKGLGASNGCAFADSPGHMPIQRMANVSLKPAPGGPPPRS
ncbi:TldD/PmbA family protein [Nonomuraea dietziae]